MVAFIDYRTTTTEKNSLSKLNINFIEVPKNPILYDAIDGHVDIQLNIIDKKEKKIIIQKDIDDTFIEKLKLYDITYIKSFSSLAEKYPGNIMLNAAILDDDIIHNFKYTDKNLISSSDNKKFINVKQGYSKCSILPVRNKAIITNDKGIYDTLKTEGYDILLLPPGDILLPGLNYGFIGGVGGKISDNSLAFFGNLNKYKYGKEIKHFLNKYDITPVYLHEGKLIDRGSLLCL